MGRSPLQIVFIAALTLGTFFRLSGLGTKMYSHDEAYTSLRAAGLSWSHIQEYFFDGQEKTVSDIQRFLRPGEGSIIFNTLDGLAKSEPQTTPLYFVLSHYWMRLVGYSPAVMRLLAALISLLAVPGMYWLSLELFRSKRTALFAAALISLSPFHLLFAQDARPYSLFSITTILSSAALLYALRVNRKWVWFLYGLLLITGIYTHTLFLFVMTAHGAYLLVNRRSINKGQFAWFIAVSLISLAAYIPWMFQVVAHFDSVKRGLNWTGASIDLFRHVQSWIRIFASPLIDLHLGMKSAIPYFLRIPALLLLGYASLFLVMNAARRAWSFLLLLIGFTTLPFFLSDFIRGGSLSTSGRYFVGLSVAVIPVVAYLVSEKLSVPKRSSANAWVLVASLIFTAQIISGLNIYVSKTWWNKNLSWNSPQIVDRLNMDSKPLLIVYDQDPTDFGDILALSLMVDKDVRFIMAHSPAVLELSGEYSNVYIYHRSKANFIRLSQEGHYQTQEVIPERLWEVIIPKKVGQLE
jgi:uncharacterized membrane protein